MGWRFLAKGCVLAALVSALAAATQPAPLAPVGSDPLDVAYSLALVERGSVTVEQVAGGGLDSKLQPQTASRLVPFVPGNEMWVPLTIRNPANTPVSWSLLVRQTSLDEVALFEQHGPQWQSRVAGDRVPQSQWSRPGRFARFDFDLDAGATRTLYLRVRNDVAAAVPLQLASRRGADTSAARADFGLAFALGALGIVVLASLFQASIYRDRTYFIYSAYALLLGLALASISGVSDELLWSEEPLWADTAKTALPLAAAGVSVWLVQALCRVRTRSVGLARWSTVSGAVVLMVAVGVAAAGAAAVPVVAGAMALSAATVVTVSLWAWRRGDRMGLWVLAAHLPLMATTALIVLRMAGVETIPFRSNVLVAVSMGFILVLMLVALIRRSRELLSLQARDRVLDTIDPLTGLPAAPIFRDRMRAAVHRWVRSRHDAVIVYVRLANYDRIKEAHGAAVAEQSVIRAAMKLQRIMNDADCFGRVDEGVLGFILETSTRRDAMLERASRLVAHGLMPLPGLKPEVTLAFHVAAAVLSENAPDAAQLQLALEAELASMGPRTRRPIRFIGDARVATEPGALAA
ncbi:MAG TPA: 7TM diverse intracellular signaling domain-containing protein [Ramlibacter sp.]|nr:7TM diverse intracellular signaling domain-containing protein [Ramlibacter sp.]